MTRAGVVLLVCAVAACAAVAAGFALVSPSAGSERSAAAAGVLIPSVRGEILPVSGGTVRSRNWSGYAVRSQSHDISGVTGTFVVPRAGSSGQLAATWAGIGGFPKRDLIQAGTAEDAASRILFGKKYFAWYEISPHPETQLRSCTGDPHCKVTPGNHISVAIKEVSGGTWSIAMTNRGHWSWSKTVSFNSSRSSAEWILEAPTILLFRIPVQSVLSSVGTVHFGPTSKYTTGGSSHTIRQGHPIKIILSGEAEPSALGANGQSFNDCAYQSSCPRP